MKSLPVIATLIFNDPAYWGGHWLESCRDVYKYKESEAG